MVRGLHQSAAALAAAQHHHVIAAAGAHGGSPPGWGAWSFEVIPAIVLLLFSALYIDAYRRARRRSERVGPGHWIPYFAGILVVVVALFSPLDPIGDKYLLSAHMLQHVLLSDVAPALLLLGLRSPLLPLGLPRPILRVVAPGGRLGRPLAILTSPWVVLPLWMAATIGWAVPVIFDFAATHPLVHDFEHLSLFYTGLGLWWVVVDPLPRGSVRPNGARLAILGISRLATATVCLPLTFLTRVEYPLYASAPRAYGLSPLGDQSLAGASMCFVEFLVFGIAFAVVFLNVLSRSEAADALGETAAASRSV
jgi:putative membrane protein